MHRITYEHLDDAGNVLKKVVWSAPDEGNVSFEERCPVQHIYEVGSDTPYGTNRGPLILHLTATLDPRVRFVPFAEHHSCCANEDRNMNGGCNNCGAPCL